MAIERAFLESNYGLTGENLTAGVFVEMATGVWDRRGAAGAGGVGRDGSRQEPGFV